MLMTAPKKKHFKIVAKTQAPPEIPVQRTGNDPAEPSPPLYHPSPDSVLHHRRCCREGCRAVIPEGYNKCFVCGCRIISTDPLNRYTIYIEEF